MGDRRIRIIEGDFEHVVNVLTIFAIREAAENEEDPELAAAYHKAANEMEEELHGEGE